MKATELREMTDVELNKQLKDLKAELFNLRFQHAINQLDNPIRIDTVNKTIVVAVKDSVQHPLYKKILKRTKKFKAHDENNEAGIGDRVEIMETRKISKDVNWRLVKIIEKAK